MPTTDDLYNRLIEIRDNLVNVKDAVEDVNKTLVSGFHDLVILDQYTNQALFQNSQQNETIICILENISRNTCELLNQSVIQTKLQTSMDEGVSALAEMYSTVNPQAALERERLKALKQQIEKCCPPPKAEPPCHYRPCKEPPPLKEPPKVEREPKPIG